MSSRAQTSVAEPAVFGGASGGKIGMWIFLVTDGMGFGAMLMAYGVLRARADRWPDPGRWLNLPLAAAMTLALLTSSLTVLLALAAARAERRWAAAGWLAVTVACGLAFLGGQGYEYHHLLSDSPRVGLGADLFGSTFYLVTGFHGLHVLAGVIYLGLLAFRSARKPLGSRLLEVAALFWHFVDLAWVPIFTFVYLLPAR
jgi:heme/copper-type cytochrome/quinol oxidase subunit 3